MISDFDLWARRRFLQRLVHFMLATRATHEELQTNFDSIDMLDREIIARGLVEEWDYATH